MTERSYSTELIQIIFVYKLNIQIVTNSVTHHPSELVIFLTSQLVNDGCK